MLCAAAIAAGGAAYFNHQQAEQTRSEASAVAKKLAPDVRQLHEVKQENRRRDDLLSAAQTVLNTPKVLDAMGRLSETLPSKVTLQSLKADENTIDLQVSVAKGVTPPGSISIAQSPFADLLLDRDAAPPAGDTSIHTYRATSKSSTP
jgi:hypothetical protein